MMQIETLIPVQVTIKFPSHYLFSEALDIISGVADCTYSISTLRLGSC